MIVNDALKDGKCPICDSKIDIKQGGLLEYSCLNRCCTYELIASSFFNKNGDKFEKRQLIFLIFNNKIAVKDLSIFKNGIEIYPTSNDSFDQDVQNGIKYWKENDRYLLEILTRTN